MLIETLLLSGAIGYHGMMNDEKSKNKNIKAFSKIAEGQNKLKTAQNKAFESIARNSIRKNAILTTHIQMFQNNIEIFRTIQFKKGKGLEELEQIEIIKNDLQTYLRVPEIASGLAMNSSQYLVSFALLGLGGMIVQDSKVNKQVASLNMAKANVFNSEVDALCTVLEEITNHANLVTHTLEKLSMLYIKSISSLSQMIKEKGTNPNLYFESDIDKINASIALTKVIYRIINTPIINQDGKIVEESKHLLQICNDKYLSTL